MEREDSTAIRAIFNLIDTPDLNDPAITGENNIALFFKSLESFESISLVAITIANNPLTDDPTKSLDAYIRLSTEFVENMIFVHTRIDYSRLHPTEELFVQL